MTKSTLYNTILQLESNLIVSAHLLALKQNDEKCGKNTQSNFEM